MKVLVIEDNPDHFELISDAFDEAFDDIGTLDYEVTLTNGLVRLLNQDYDICLCDLQLPDSNTEETIARLNLMETETPIVVLTSLNDRDIGRQLIQKGVQDYLPKEELNANLLYRICIYAIERKQNQVILEKINRDQLLFCQSLSHDFKSPLIRIGQFVDFLKNDLQPRVTFSEEEAQWFELIEKNVHSITILVQELYQYLALDESLQDVEDIDLSQLLGRVAESVKSNCEKEVTLNWKELPVVQGSESQLFLLFQNLINNSVRYNENSPVIDIIELRNERKGFYTVAIKDNGIGMDEDSLEIIFEPFKKLFSTVSNEGTGLGLSIVKRVVDNHKGRIKVKSKVGVGSEFIISIPLTQKRSNCSQ